MKVTEFFGERAGEPSKPRKIARVSLNGLEAYAQDISDIVGRRTKNEKAEKACTEAEECISYRRLEGQVEE